MMRFRWIIPCLTLLAASGVRSASAGGPIASGSIVSGTLAGPGFTESWTFSGTAGQTVLIAAVTTGGSVNTLTTLRTPGGTAVSTSVNDRTEFVLTSTGTWTIQIDDSGLNDAGTYALGFLNVTAGPLTDGSDPNGGPIVSSDVVSGTASGAGDFDAYTFSATSGERVAIHAFATGGAGYNTNIVLYGPGGAQFSSSGGGDQLNIQLNATGTWTFVIEDLGLDTAGSYALSFLNITAGPYSSGSDPDTGTLVSNQIRTGSFQSGVDMDAWTFTGTSGQTVVFAGLTPGGPHNATLALYPPGGGIWVASTVNDRLEHTLTATGTWTLVLYDAGMNDTGAYTLGFLNVNGGPLTDGADPNGGPIVSSDVVSGTASGAGDFDAYTFSATSGDRVAIHAFATGGAGYNTNIALYGPDGAQFTSSGGGDQLNIQLNATGTWTAVIEDLSLDTAGSYALSFLNITAGPYSSGSDPDTGTLVSNQIRTGSFQSGVDMDAWTFTGSSGQTVVFAGLTPGGPHNATLALYPPGGGIWVASTVNDRLEHTLTATGTWTLVLYDAGLNDTGAYTLGFLNVNGGPLTDGVDPNGGLMLSNDNRSGTSSGAADFDAWTFLGTNDDRILISAFSTGGVGHNTNLVLYGPTGAQFTSSGGGDQIDIRLNATGLWTVVVEDFGLDTPGSYALCHLNLGAGPLNTNGDPGVVETGVPVDVAIAQAADLDGFTFYGASGETATINAVTLSGAMNTQIALYPPGGGGALGVTINDTMVQPLTTSGYYRVVITDSGLNDTGTYRLTLTGSGAQSGLPVAGSELPNGVRVALAPASPSPFHSSTRLSFRLRHDVSVTLRIFDARGALVRTLLDAMLPSGSHEAVWDGTDDRGRAAGSGVYHLQLRADGDEIRRKVVRVR